MRNAPHLGFFQRGPTLCRPDLLTFDTPERHVLTMYSTSWCGYCHRLKSQLDRENISYEVVDIEQDPKAAEYVMSVNGGNQTVPTVRFDDGSAMTNPTVHEVRARLVKLALS
jgi:mycoredoxin